jgi:hypothetical protein
MISLQLSEQELFDLIMAVYASGNTLKATEQDPDGTKWRQALLDKLHGAFDRQFAATAR